MSTVIRMLSLRIQSGEWDGTGVILAVVPPTFLLLSVFFGDWKLDSWVRWLTIWPVCRQAKRVFTICAEFQSGSQCGAQLVICVVFVPDFP